jgi:nucleoside 2-deoxyribosyltransferase
MATCFVIQPFDCDKYDKRYEDIFAPAIRAADLEPYRVDRDPSVEVPIESIEAGIRNAAACLAEITEDNPNVWYELGYAFAQGRPVVLVCTESRSGFPFDIQHRSIITYRSDAPRDFEGLRQRITERLKARVNQEEALRQLSQSEQVAPVGGVTQPELFVLATLAGSTGPTDESVALNALRNEVERAGLTSVGFALGVHRLRTRGFIELISEQDRDGYDYYAAKLLLPAWAWMDTTPSANMRETPASSKLMSMGRGG